MSLEIIKKINGKQLFVTLSGSLDALTVDDFDREFMELPEEVESAELDFSDVEYISSAGLRSLLLAKKQAVKQDKKLVIKDPQQSLVEVFKVTGFVNLLEIVYSNQTESDVSAPADGFYPLRPVQRWLVDTHFRKADSTMMNNGALMKLDEAIDLERLAVALNDLLTAYDIFRCRLCFHPDTGEICQRFDGDVPKVRVEILSEQAFEQRKQELKMPYTLINSPLYRIYLMLTPSGKYIYADFYHAIMDGLAIVVLFWRELNKRYQGKNVSRKRASYAEYVWEEAKELAAGQEEAHRYWQNVLAGFDVQKHLPPVDQQQHDNWQQGCVQCQLGNIHKDFFTNKQAYSENTFMLAASMLAMAKVTGEKDVIMSWVHNARTTVQEMRIMGLMLNQYPIRWDFSQDMQVGQFLTGLEERINEGISYGKGLDEVYRDDLEGECASFILQKDTDINAAYSLDGTTSQIVEMPANKRSAAENVLDIVVSVLHDGNYQLTLAFDGSRYTDESMERYAALIDEMVLALQAEDRSIAEILA
ncbi:anti-sigma factor antagonist [Selenomonas sp. AE3005]|uniref:anti-sigma factor antagonist n=1 Tax=Selenomonas sp. AE3005 TaxID=1485543 RepID=UPI00048831BA|nr:anti-sigma factor antagonist [Selenomonas sp. AE3005]